MLNDVFGPKKYPKLHVHFNFGVEIQSSRSLILCQIPILGQKSSRLAKCVGAAKIPLADV